MTDPVIVPIMAKQKRCESVGIMAKWDFGEFLYIMVDEEGPWCRNVKMSLGFCFLSFSQA